MYSDKPGKHLTLAIDDLNGTSRSISASPNPPSPSTYMMGSADTFGMMTAGGLGGMGSMGSAMSGLAGLGSGGGNGSSGEGDDDQMESHFGRADRKSKKSNRKAAPRTSRACLACRRQKMRCEGADDPPCRRCVSNGVDCMFERRSDYLLNPEDRAWQNGVEKRLEHLGRAIDQILAHLGAGGNTATQAGINGDASNSANFWLNNASGVDNGAGGASSALSGLPPPHTAAAAFGEVPSTAAFYDHHHQQFHQNRHHHDGPSGIMPNTAPAGIINPNILPGSSTELHNQATGLEAEAGGLDAGTQSGNVGIGAGGATYIIPTAAETAAIAARGKYKRPRGATVPGNLPSAGFTPTTGIEAAFHLFSPRTAAMGASDMDQLPNGGSYSFPGSLESGTGMHGDMGVSSSNASDMAHQHYGMDMYTTTAKNGRPGDDLATQRYNHQHHLPLTAADGTQMQQQQQDGVPRSLGSPMVRFANMDNHHARQHYQPGNHHMDQSALLHAPMNAMNADGSVYSHSPTPEPLA